MSSLTAPLPTGPLIAGASSSSTSASGAPGPLPAADATPPRGHPAGEAGLAAGNGGGNPAPGTGSSKGTASARASSAPAARALRDPARRPAPRRALRWGVAAAVALALAAGGWHAHRQGWLFHPPAADSAAAADAATAGASVVASVDGKTIVADELGPLLNAGVDRAIALDRTINKVVAAEAARSRYADAARTALVSVEREVLAQLYLQRRSQELAQAVTDADIAAYYEANVRAEDYAGFRLRYYLTRDAADAANVRALLDRRDPAAQARLSPLAPAPAAAAGTGNGAGTGTAAAGGATGAANSSTAAATPGPGNGGFIALSSIPYGLGRVVREAKAGDVIGPVLVRDGALLLVLDEKRPGTRPALDEVKAEIRAVLADRRLGEELQALRRQARINLN